MAVLKLSTLATGIIAALGTLSSTALAVAPYSDAQSTETAAPQELGSMTADGSLVYSMNICTIVHNTECQVSMSTGGPAPSPTTAASSETFIYTPPPNEASSSAAAGTTPASPGESGGGGDVPPGSPVGTFYTTTDNEGIPTVVTSAGASESASGSGYGGASSSGASEGEYTTGGGGSDSGGSTTKNGGPSGTASGAPGTTTPGAGTALHAAPALAMGVAGVAAAICII